MLKTRRRRWLLVAALFFLAAAGIAIARVVTAQGEEASGVRHILRTNALGELVTAGTGEVQGTTADGAAFSDNPVIVGGVDGAGDAQQLFTNSFGAVMIAGTTAQPSYFEGTVSDNAAAGTQRPLTVSGVDAAGDVQRLLASPAGELHTLNGGFVCSQSTPISTAAAGTTQIIGLSGTTVIYLCHVSLSWDAAVDFRLVYGTGANCGTGQANLTADYQNTTALALDFGTVAAVRAPAGNAVCIVQTGAGNSGGVVSYAQF